MQRSIALRCAASAPLRRRASTSTLLGASLLLCRRSASSRCTRRANESLARVTAQLVNMLRRARRDVGRRADPAALPDAPRGAGLLRRRSCCSSAVALFGDIVNGARRWLHVGVTRFQPSEMMKIAVPLMLAWYFDRYEATLRLRDFAVAAVLLAVPVVLIARQPDLGTAVLIAAVGFYVIFFAGLGWRVIVGARRRWRGEPAAARGVVLHDYQRQRVLTLLDPTQDPLGAGYHTIQSTIAVGSGGSPARAG